MPLCCFCIFTAYWRGGIIEKNVKKYMISDLLLLTIVGCVLEVLSVKFGAEVLYSAPTAMISLLITFLAVTRWNLWGLIVCPFLAIATFYGGTLIEIEEMQAVYDYKLLISVFLGLCTMGLNVIIFKKFKTNNIVNSPWLILMLLVDYVLFCTIQVYSYRLMCSGSLLHPGERLFSISRIVDGETVVKTWNVCLYGESGFIFNLFGLAVLYVGTYVMRSQGVVCNAVQRLIDDKKNAELDLKDRSFSIEEAEDVDSVGEDQTSKTEQD